MHQQQEWERYAPPLSRQQKKKHVMESNVISASAQQSLLSSVSWQLSQWNQSN
jgi:hypothetical protein